MKLSREEIQLALRLSRTIQHYLEITKGTNLRSTDVFPYLKRHGFFKQDQENGKTFRSFLKKLYKANMLKSLVPQCNYIPSLQNPNYGEWFFHDAKDAMPTIKRNEANGEDSDFEKSISQITNKYAKMDIHEATDIVKMLIAGVNPISERVQDNLGVCADPTVVEALKTIIDPEAYQDEMSCQPKRTNNTSHKVVTAKKNDYRS